MGILSWSGVGVGVRDRREPYSSAPPWGAICSDSCWRRGDISFGAVTGCNRGIKVGYAPLNNSPMLRGVSLSPPPPPCTWETYE